MGTSKPKEADGRQNLASTLFTCFPCKKWKAPLKYTSRLIVQIKRQLSLPSLDCNYARWTLSSVKLDTLRVLEARNPNKKALSQNS